MIMTEQNQPTEKSKEQLAEEARIEETIKGIQEVCGKNDTSLQVFMDYSPMGIMPRARIVINPPKEVATAGLAQTIEPDAGDKKSKRSQR